MGFTSGHPRSVCGGQSSRVAAGLREIECVRREVKLSDIAHQFGVILRRNGDEWVSLCPFHTEDTPSFTIFPGKDHVQRMHCFGCDDGRGDVLDFVQKIKGVDIHEAIRILGGGKAGPNVAPKRVEVRDVYAEIVPLDPPGEIEPGKRVTLYNPKRAGTDRATGSFVPSMVHPYRREDGSLIGYVLRHDLPDGGKETPMVMWVRLPTGSECWARFPFPKARPLYGLHEVDDRKQVIVVEGEKARDQLAKATRRNVVTWPGGSNGVKHVDWSPLAGREIILWPDLDIAGVLAIEGVRDMIADYGTNVRALDLTEWIEVTLARPSRGAGKAYTFADWQAGAISSKGWDAADAVDDGWIGHQLDDFMRALVRPFPLKYTAKQLQEMELARLALERPLECKPLPAEPAAIEGKADYSVGSAQDGTYTDPDSDDRPTSAPSLEDRPRIPVVAGEIHKAVDLAIRVLSESKLGVYARGGDLVRAVTYRAPEGTIGIAKKAENVAPSDCAVVVSPFSEAALVETLTRRALFVKYNARVQDFVPCNCPPEVAAMVLARRGDGWKMPPLRAIISAPTLRPDGSVISEPGYDAATGLLLVGDRMWRAVPDQPTMRQALDALDVLSEPIAGFPFVDNADRAAALALLITAVLRPSLKTAPMFAVSAPSAGTGKSLLVDIAAIMATGRQAAVVAPTPDEAELEKRIGAVALAGDQVISIDNVSHALKSDLLCQLLTQDEVQVRVLGASKTVRIPSTGLLCCTGNNLSIVGDLNRRVIRIRLDAQCEQPDARSFKFDPCRLAKSRRSDLVASSLTVVRAFLSAGAPKQASPMGSFEDWSDLVRSALLWLNMGDCRGDVEAFRAEDPEKSELATILDALPTWRFTAKEVVAKAANDADLREALASLADRSGGISSKRLGQYLRRHRGVIVDGRKIAQVSSEGHHGAVWQVQAVIDGD